MPKPINKRENTDSLGFNFPKTRFHLPHSNTLVLREKRDNLANLRSCVFSQHRSSLFKLFTLRTLGLNGTAQPTRLTELLILYTNNEAMPLTENFAREACQQSKSPAPRAERPKPMYTLSKNQPLPPHCGPLFSLWTSLHTIFNFPCTNLHSTYLSFLTSL